MLILPVFIAKQYHLLRDKKGSYQIVPSDYYEKNLHDPADKHFIIMISASNEGPFIERCLHSIFQQRYGDYEVYLFDAASSDGTYEKAAAYIAREHVEGRVELIRRDKEGEIFNAYYQVVKAAKDTDVIVHLPGGDWLANPEVLSIINDIYSNQDVWLTYPQYIEYPSYQKGILKALPKKHVHKRRISRTPWVTSPMRTFYAGLLKQVDVELNAAALFEEGEKALMLPMAEMGKSHVRFIPEVLYVHTTASEREQEARYGAVTHDLPAVVLFAERGGRSLLLALQALSNNLTGHHQIHVMTDDPANVLSREFPHVAFHVNPHSFKQKLLSLFATPSIFITTDSHLLDHPLDLSHCHRLRTGFAAYGLLFNLSERRSATPLSFCEKGLYSSNSTVAGLGTMLYDTALLVQDLERLHFVDIPSLMQEWKQRYPFKRTILHFSKASRFGRDE